MGKDSFAVALEIGNRKVSQLARHSFSTFTLTSTLSAHGHPTVDNKSSRVVQCAFKASKEEGRKVDERHGNGLLQGFRGVPNTDFQRPITNVRNLLNQWGES